MKRILLTLIALFALHAAAGAAAPDPMANPMLATIDKAGGKLYYMGNRYGLDGWFVVKDGQVQMLYSTPDNKGVLIGGLFGQDGENVSTLQVETLAKNNKEVATLLANMGKDQQALEMSGAAPAPIAAAQPTVAGLPAEPLSPGERLIRDLSSASTVLVGAPSAPELLMVMDPHCPHCQATWKALRDSVFRGSLHIRMIPIGAPDSDSERAAAIFLGVADPLNIWDKYVAGDHSLLMGAPPASALAAIRANHAVTDNWNIQDTPYLVYRDKAGKVKVVVGEPGKLSAMLVDLGL